MQLGLQLRAARTGRGLTMAELAAASGLSKGFVSQVENDRTSPSLDTLERLAVALGLTVVDLLRGAGAAPTGPYVVPGALQPATAPQRRLGLVGRERLLPAGPVQAGVPVVREISPPGAALRSFVVDLPPGTALGDSDHRHEGSESLVVLVGYVTAEQDGSPTPLAAGDALTWTAGARHRLLNRHPDPARLLITLTAPATLGAGGLVGPPAARRVAAPPPVRPLRLVAMRAARRTSV